jgi:hypothetical protein
MGVLSVWKLGKSWKSFMNFKETIEESLDGVWNNRQYGGASELPRKDYQPYSSSNGYSFPYQNGAPPIFPPTTPPPDNTPSLPWPLGTVTDDLADGFVYTLAAFNKMKMCLNENPSLNSKQKIAIKKLMKACGKAIYLTRKVGENIVAVANLAENPPSQVENKIF